ncbi:hypothetical protein HYH02_014672 [Chlamydomonas schloesseri]|uniref:Nicotinate-nucleotide--dimethylbenzimidazole phosphoribosyltransferase n=1 Tax=Chlamydomonas schloesseri TaxID=2026947 RepID=A0A835SW93_9CHLO|nr:hypothetical protein HYH02_014672 [Chlamydomonas schloesseri]|eukprot:KAG2427026.1 hypothetical protein HYH02_014672 [Chlamydomonas schloesseri]
MAATTGRAGGDDWATGFEQAKAVMDAKAKPVGSLGALESLACRLAAAQRSVTPHVGRAALLVFAADHGVAAARPAVSAFPAAVSAPVFRAVVRGQAASAVLCGANGVSDLIAVDVGLAADVTDAVPPPPPPPAAGAGAGGSGGLRISVLHRKVRPDGSRSMLAGPAMSEEELAAAMAAGAEAVRGAVRGILPPAVVAPPPAPTAVAEASEGEAGLPEDWRQCVICLGEVGIGNTTAAAALLAALTGAAPEEVCGRGTGVDDAGLDAKRRAVADALAVNAELIKGGGGSGGGGALAALRAVGGLELAAMAGAALEAAALGVPVVADGFISGAACLAALAHDPQRVGRVLLLSHRSAERGAALLVSALTGATPLAPHLLQQNPQQQQVTWPAPAVLDMGLRLGEGTGAVLVLPLLRSAAAVLRDMASLEAVLAG